MATEWKKVKLGELGTISRGRSKHRPRNDPSLFGGDYPFIQTADVKMPIYTFLNTHKPIMKKDLNKANFGNQEHFV